MLDRTCRPAPRPVPDFPVGILPAERTKSVALPGFWANWFRSKTASRSQKGLTELPVWPGAHV